MFKSSKIQGLSYLALAISLGILVPVPQVWAMRMTFGMTQMLVQAQIHIPIFPGLEKDSAKLQKHLIQSPEIPEAVAQAMPIAIADADINNRFHHAFFRVLDKAGVLEKDLQNFRFVVTNQNQLQEVIHDGIRYIGLPETAIRAASKTDDAHKIVSAIFPLEHPESVGLSRNFRETQYVLETMGRMPILPVKHTSPSARPFNLVELIEAFRGGLIPDFSSRTQVAAFAFYRASGFGDPTTVTPDVLPSLIAKVQKKWPHLELDKGIFPSVSFQTRVNDAPADPELAQLLKEGIKNAHSLKMTLQNPAANIGDYKKLFGDEASKVAEKVAEAPADLTARASVLFQIINQRYSFIIEPKTQENLIKKMLQLVHYIGYMDPHATQRMESPGLRDQLAAFNTALSARTEFLNANQVADAFPDFRLKIARTLALPLPSEERLSKLSQKLSEVTAPTSAKPEERATVRELSFGEAPFQSCLGGTDCFSRTYPELALHPDHHAFTQNFGGVEDGKISVFLGTVEKGIRVAFVDKVQNIPNEEIPSRLEAMRQSLLTRGYLLALPVDGGDHNGISNYETTRKFLKEKIKDHFPIQKEAEEFRPHRGDVGFPRGSSRAFKSPKVQILGPLHQGESLGFRVGKVPAAYREAGLNFAELNEQSFELRKGKEADKLAYIKLHEVQRQLKLATHGAFNYELIRWISDPQESPRVRYQAVQALLRKAPSIGFRALKTLKSDPGALASIFNSLWQKPELREILLTQPLVSLSFAQTFAQIRELVGLIPTRPEFGKRNGEAFVKFLKDPRERARLAEKLGYSSELNPFEQIRHIVGYESSNPYFWIGHLTLAEAKWWLKDGKPWEVDTPQAIKREIWVALADHFSDPELLETARLRLGLNQGPDEAPELLILAMKQSSVRAASAALPHSMNLNVSSRKLLIDDEGRTPLQYALLNRNFDSLVPRLFHAGAKMPEAHDPIWKKVKPNTYAYEYHPEFRGVRTYPVIPDVKTEFVPPPAPPAPKPARKPTPVKADNLATVAEVINDLAQARFGDLFVSRTTLHEAIKGKLPKGVSKKFSLDALLGETLFERTLTPEAKGLLGLPDLLAKQIALGKSAAEIHRDLKLAESGVSEKSVEALALLNQIKQRLANPPVVEATDAISQKLKALAAFPANWDAFASDRALSDLSGISLNELVPYRKKIMAKSLDERTWGLFHATGIAPIRLARWLNAQVQAGNALGNFAQWNRKSPVSAATAKKLLGLPTFFAMLTPEARLQLYDPKAAAAVTHELAHSELRDRYSALNTSRNDGCRISLGTLKDSAK